MAGVRSFVEAASLAMRNGSGRGGADRFMLLLKIKMKRRADSGY
jgi:hypothetical protein